MYARQQHPRGKPIFIVQRENNKRGKSNTEQ